MPCYARRQAGKGKQAPGRRIWPAVSIRRRLDTYCRRYLARGDLAMFPRVALEFTSRAGIGSAVVSSGQSSDLSHSIMAITTSDQAVS